MLIAPLLLASLAGGDVEPRLARHLASLESHEPVRVLVRMEEGPRKKALRREVATLDRGRRHAAVRAALSADAARSQVGLRRTLAPLLASGRVAATDELWIANARTVTCEAGLVEVLAAVPGVELVSWDPELGLEELADATPGPVRPDPAGTRAGGSAGSTARNAATANIVGHQAPMLWDLGIDGRGTLVLNVDSGVANDHPDLAKSIWENPGEVAGNGVDDDGNGFVDDTWGWDFANSDNDPYDGGHGTRTAGIVVGDGTANGGVATGMAPGATMAVARVNSVGQLLAAYQYAITIGADCVTSSFSVKWPSSPDYHAFRRAMEAELAAGIVHANSIGNQGLFLATHPAPWNIATPGNCPGPWVHPEQVHAGLGSVLSVAGIVLGTDALYHLGGQGPSAWEDVTLSSPSFPHPQDPSLWDYPWANGTLPGLLKPDLAAYTLVKTTAGSSLYDAGFGGTSAATPHVGGALCLLLDANSAALPRQVSQALQETALDVEEPGKDTRTGAGKLLAFDAALRVRSLVTAFPQDPGLGESFRIELTGPPGRPFTLLAGATPGRHPTLLGFELEVADPVPLLSMSHAGWADPIAFDVVVPANPVLSGLTLYFQVITDDTTGRTGQWLLSLLEPLTIR